MKLHLGVIVIPYVNVPEEYKRHRRKSGTAGTETTGDVATWLENKYGVMAVFFDQMKDQIAAKMAESVAGAIENLFLGGPVQALPLATAEAFIDTEFKKFLSSRKIESLGIVGVPTKAAIDGVNHRLKSGRGPRRPSFLDTGLYSASFKSWFE